MIRAMIAKFYKYFVPFSLLLVTFAAYAGGGVVFSGLAYQNPAFLADVDDKQVDLMLIGLNNSVHLTGTNNGASGSADNQRPWTIFPDIQFASRLNDKFVWDINVTHPFMGQSDYAPSSFVSSTATLTQIFATNLGTDLSYDINRDLSIGAGVYGQYLTASFNSMVANLPFENEGTSLGVGWDAGLYYNLTHSTVASLSYFSKVIHHLEGPSSYPGALTTTATLDNVLPAVASLVLYQGLTPQWTAYLGANYIYWDDVKSFTFHNTALAPVISVPGEFKNSWIAFLGNKYDINPKWWVGGYIGYDKDSVPSDSVRSPGGNAINIGAGTGYQVTRNLNAALRYSHSFVGDTHINTRTPSLGLATNAVASTEGDSISLEFIWKIGRVGPDKLEEPVHL